MNPLYSVAEIEGILINARDRVDALDERLMHLGREVPLLDNRRENGVRQCIDRALYLLAITEDQLEADTDA